MNVTKTKKMRAKTGFVKARNELHQMLDDAYPPSKAEIRAKWAQVSDAMGEFLLACDELYTHYDHWGEVDKRAKLTAECDEAEKQFMETEYAVEERLRDMSMAENSERSTPRQLSTTTRPKHLDEIEKLTRQLESTFEQVKRDVEKNYGPKFFSTPRESKNPAYGKMNVYQAANSGEQYPSPGYRDQQMHCGQTFDYGAGTQMMNTGNATTPQPPRYDSYMSPANDASFDKLLKKVPVPKFNGDKRHFQSWKAAFIACVEKTRTAPEYKLLRLKDCLVGEPLHIIQGLGHSAAAYEVAKMRLDRKYGGQRRQIIIHLGELDKFKPVREGQPRDLERLAELMDNIILNLQESGEAHELGGGSLFISLQKKLNEALLMKFQRWILERNMPGSVQSLYMFVNEEAELMTAAAETIKGLQEAPSSYGKQNQSQKKSKENSFVTVEKEEKSESKKNNSRYDCAACDASHGLWSCDKFRGMTTTERWKIARDGKVCFRCLSRSHMGPDCPRSRQCGLDNCKSYHHRLLHEPRQASQQKTEVKPAGKEEEKPASSQEPNTERSMTTTIRKHSENCDNLVSLRTVPVYVTNGNRRVKINALLDEASTKTYLNADVAAQLQLEGDQQELRVNVLDDQETILKTSHVKFMINSLDGKINKEAMAYTTEKVTGKMEMVNWNNYKSRWNHLRSIEFPKVGRSATVDLLIGVDLADLMLSEREVRGEPGEPVARLTPLGWTCITGGNAGREQRTNFTFSTISDDLDRTLRQYWDIDETTSCPIVKPQEKKALKIVTDSLVHEEDGHYSVAVPWNENKMALTNNYKAALKRLENTERRLEKSPELKKNYTEVFQKYEDKGYVRKIPQTEEQPKDVWYLPHFAVLRPDKSTTKTRVVFDASAKYEGMALNDAMISGPKLQNELSEVLLRFRRNPVAVVCDISEMYLQIHLKEEDKKYHRFLWRSESTQKAPDVYEMQRVVFGTSSSPFMAQFVTQQHAMKYSQEYPLGAETVTTSTYMDDSMDSVENVEKGIQLCEELQKIWELAGMHPRKWLSNSPEILKNIREEDCAAEVDLDKGEMPCIKTLGLMWSSKEDNFLFNVTLDEDLKTDTKRQFLKKIATLFDPLGFLSPIVIKAKILLQEMWTSGADWDEKLDPGLVARAKQWFTDLQELPKLRIPRCLREPKVVTRRTLHVFGDASEEAFGAVAYLLHEYEDKSRTTRLVTSKSKVAPLQSVSIPRMELMAAVVGLHVAETVGKALEINREEWVFWSDSMNVLHWIRGNSRKFKPFVAHRVGEIQQKSSPYQWRYVPTGVNPADILSRGMDVGQLASEKLWWNGPDFLTDEPAEWPKTELKSQSPEPTEEMKQKYVAMEPQGGTYLTSSEEDRSLLDPEKFSSWTRLCRVAAWTSRFLENCQLPKDLRRIGPLEPEEIHDVEKYFIVQAQNEVFKDEITAVKAGKEINKRSKLVSLKPTVDEEGVLRSDSRLKYSEDLPWKTRCPIILPRNHRVTQLIIMDHHKNSHHGGTNLVLSHLSTQYWIVHGREAIRETVGECMKCRRTKVSPGQQIMAPLPQQRTKVSLRAFQRTSVDFAGPFETKQGRGKTRQKRYLCLFTCLSSRAVHLELAFGLDTSSFLNAFYRMAARRGMPEYILSDNGTNFVGAVNELKQLEELDKRQIQDSTSSQYVKWDFNPPLAPHFNGVHEVMVKAAKKAIYGILSSADITDEELLSAITGAESLLNSRPLTYQSADTKDILPLTPNHFLHGQLGGSFAPEVVDTVAYNPRQRWRRVQELVRHFWHRWLREWIPGLGQRKKWTTDRADFKVGDVVIVMSTDTPRGKWPLGRIREVYPGQDGKVRVVDVQVGKTLMKRPIVKICPLEVCDEK